MEHLTLKAVTEQVTDEGVFEAVISTETADREQDVVSAEAMVTALKKWNRPLPLAWNHSTAAADIIGSVEPMSAAVKDAEVVVNGIVDLDSEVGREAWRSFKSRTIGFSFGYMALASSKREGGGRNLTELDVFEITATPTPMNNDTRVLSTKGAEEPEDVPAIDDATDDDPPEDKSQAQDPPPNHAERRELLHLLTDGVKAPPPQVEEQPVESPSQRELRRSLHDAVYGDLTKTSVKAAPVEPRPESPDRGIYDLLWETLIGEESK